MTAVSLGAASAAELRELCERIGNTPVACVPVAGGELRLKLEGENPGGSVKDRLARFIFRGLRDTGRLRAGDRLVDSISGNFGVAMAWVAAEVGDLPALTDEWLPRPPLALAPPPRRAGRPRRRATRA